MRLALVIGDVGFNFLWTVNGAAPWPPLKIANIPIAWVNSC